MPFKIIKPANAERTPLEARRGETLRLVDGAIGAEKLDVHINVLAPNGPPGRLHHHTAADNVYIVKSGEGLLTIEDAEHRIVADDVVYIPAGVHHALRNASDRDLTIYEIYAPAGKVFDFIIGE